MTTGRMQVVLAELKKLASRRDNQTADRELLNRFRANRDEAAFAEIVRRHEPMLLRLCRRVLHNPHDAEDICQAAFLLLAQKVTCIRWHESIAGWLYQVAYRMSLKARRSAKSRKRHEAASSSASPSDPVAALTVRELARVFPLQVLE